MLLTMKIKVVLPLPNISERNDLYCRKRWRRVQYLANDFCSRWKREYMQSLQVRQKRIKTRRNLMVNDVVIVKDHNLLRNSCGLDRVIDGLVRKVKLMMADSNIDNQGKRTRCVNTMERPIHSLVHLVEWDNGEDQGIPAKELL